MQQINLPIGGVAVVAVFFLVRPAPPLGSDPSEDRSIRSLVHRTVRLDWVGAILNLAAVTCLVMALQWGGNTKPWGSAAVIVCLVIAAVSAVALVFWERFLGPKAMTPPAIFK
jgi:hypothetical protein